MASPQMQQRSTATSRSEPHESSEPRIYAQSSLIFSALHRDKTRLEPWRWPSFWSFLLGFGLQLIFGIFTTLISFTMLMAADPTRCPVAVGADRMKPFYSWIIGVVLGVVACEFGTIARHSANGSWVIWGAVTELWRIERWFPR